MRIDTSSGDFSVSTSALSIASSRKDQVLEEHILPFLHDLRATYNHGISLVSFGVELLQFWAFALNPRHPGNRILWSIIYAFQFPFWDADFTNGAIGFRGFLAFYGIVAALTGTGVVFALIALRYTHWAMRQVRRIGYRHVLQFLTTVFLIPTIQTFLAAFVCQRRMLISNAVRQTESVNTSFEPHLVYFPTASCEGGRAIALTVTSVILLVLWGLLSYVILVGVLPVDREDVSVRRHSDYHVDRLLFVYKVGLCVTIALTTAYNALGTGTLVVALLSFFVAFLHGLWLPYYNEWVNRGYAVAFTVIGWSATSMYIAYRVDAEVFVHQGGFYAVLVLGAALLAPVAWWLAGWRYDGATRRLLRRATRRAFVPLAENPFTLAALQANMDLLPFPRRLPGTDRWFSPHHHTALEVLEDGLREEVLLQQQRDKAAATEGRVENLPGTTTAAPAAALEVPSATEVLRREGLRLQVVSPTVSVAWFTSDAEASTRFLHDWQMVTSTFPTPYMVYFACRIYHRFLLRYPRAPCVLIAYISFLCDFAPSLSRVSLCLDLRNTCVTEQFTSLEERLLLYYYNLLVKESLGMRSALHVKRFQRIRAQHKDVLLRTALFWRCLGEESRQIVSLYYFSSALAMQRWRAFTSYMTALTVVVDDGALLRNAGAFLDQALYYPSGAAFCRDTADVLAQLQAMRLQRTFQDSSALAAATAPQGAEEDHEEGGSEGGGESSHLNDAGSSLASGTLASSGTRASSLLLSEGRSSQSKIRNSKSTARQMVERVRMAAWRRYNEVCLHLHWRVLTVSNIISLIVILVILFLNGMVSFLMLSRWDNYRSFILELTMGQAFVHIFSYRIYRTGAQLPNDPTTILSTTERENLRSNVSYLRAIAQAASASHNELIFGRSQPKQSILRSSITSLTSFARFYYTQSNYEEWRTTFVTVMSVVITAGLRAADFLLTGPTSAEFVQSVDTIMLSNNVQRVLDPLYATVTKDFHKSATDFATELAIVFAAMVIVTMITLFCVGYSLVWNNRRAASILSSELQLFFLIPQESVKRISMDAYQKLDSFLGADTMGVTARRLVGELGTGGEPPGGLPSTRRGPSRKSGLTSARLLSHLMESGGLETVEATASTELDETHVTTPAEANRTPPAAPKEEEAEAEAPPPATSPSQTALSASTGDRGETGCTFLDIYHISPTGALAGEEEESARVPATRSSPAPEARTTATTATTATMAAAHETTTAVAAVARTNAGTAVGAPGGARRESEGAGGVSTYPMGYYLLALFLTFALLLAGVALLLVSVFALYRAREMEDVMDADLNCVMQVGNGSFSSVFYTMHYLVSQRYDGYLLAESALLDAVAKFLACRGSINSTLFFNSRHAMENTALITVALTARNAVDLPGPYSAVAFPIVIDFTWSPYERSTSAVRNFRPYLTPAQLEAWAPYTTSAADYALPPSDRRELALNTFVGPFGLAGIESLIQTFTLLVEDMGRQMDERMQEVESRIRRDLILTLVFFVLCFLVALVNFSLTRAGRRLWLLMSAFLVALATSIIMAGVLLHFSLAYVSKMRLSLSQRIPLFTGSPDFLRMAAFSNAYPFIEQERAVLELLNMTTATYMRGVMATFLPSNDGLHSTFLPQVQELLKARSTYFHYAWMSIVCAIHGRGDVSPFAHNPQVENVRWDMSTDATYQAYILLYPGEPHFTNYNDDVTASNPAAMMALAQGTIASIFMQDLARKVLNKQTILATTLLKSFQDSVQSAWRTSQTLLWTTVALTAVTLVLFFVFFGAICAMFVRAFSRSKSEHVVYKAAFSTSTKYIIVAICLILLLAVVTQVLCIALCFHMRQVMLVATYQLQSLSLGNRVLSYVSSLSSTTSRFSYSVIQNMLTTILNDGDALLRNAFLTSVDAQNLREKKNLQLFGPTTPFEVFSPFSSNMLGFSSCADPTNPVDGNQQPIILQLYALIDITRLIAALPIGDTDLAVKTEAYREDAFTRIASLQHMIYSRYPSMLSYIESHIRMYKIVVVMLLVLAAVITLLAYVFLIYRTEVHVRQQSVGVKMMLTGLPGDILNTVPEIAEFYDPEAGSADDQMRRKIQQSERLLQNVLPPNISRRLQNGERVIADAHESVTVVFASLVGFDQYSHRLDLKQVVTFLNGLVVAFDHIVELLDLEKIKTIGETYFFGGGLTKKTERDHAIRCMECSLFFFQALEDYNSRHNTPNIQLRVGINTDPAVAGVIGNKKVAYDLWGDCVNTASRMYSTGISGRIQVSDSTYRQLTGYYHFEDRHVQAKGKGTLLTHMYVGRLKNTAYTDLNWRVSH